MRTRDKQQQEAISKISLMMYNGTDGVLYTVFRFEDISVTFLKVHNA